MDRKASRQPASPPQRVLLAVVADQAEDREALSSAFAAEPKFRVISSCSLDRAPSVIDGQPVDAIIGFVDDEQAWRRFRALADRFPDQLSVLMVTDPDAVGAVADGKVLNAVVGVTRQSIAREAAGIADGAAREFGVRGTPTSNADPLDRRLLEQLSEREREVLVHTANGLAIKEIALAIKRSYATVATHRNNIMDKIGLHDRVALTRFAIRTGLIEA